ncbi:hypothetical protein ABB37_03978 [Leptomonas pyrrhocoris]|uniref:Armadillo repeat-containing protein 1 n=1 Tax=Leptomonas pyrrhocoris TaxID=157538 RepID=A0A0M9G3L2_LEPPY|nr:hypothetical protein ABB37_03978 [Leptomonas pyrrhocoris]XP_015660105.1 hypothetical protein ABB37_03978 [Leptomonas pyrrhocoris]KPA81665.1 hypothetical protein ABB37_03978 [Leptomonas pyrrhocoris]KPA81666.1 hypothetical protein ABB37_03978 [Leptomonas pyrrhocoris]|eukprot:XP_015660104.1 hypothetical protein ABB37_03978 [Leptomonas pyrrhocoris]
MATLNTELSLVRRFHALLQNYDARPAVAQRNTLPTLSRFLRSKDREIRKLSLEAVYLLAEHPENLELLGSDRELVDGVVEIYDAAQYDDPELCELSSNTLDLLASTFADGDPREKVVARRAEQETGAGPMGTSRLQAVAHPRTGTSSDLKDLSNAVGEYDTIVGMTPGGGRAGEIPVDADQLSIVSNGTGFETASCSSRPTRRVAEEQVRPSEVIRGVGKDCPLSIVLEIPALDAMTDISEIEEILQTTRGVISYTVTASAHQVRVFLSAFAQAPLQNLLAEAGYENILASAERMRYQAGDGGNQSLNNSFFFDEGAKRPTYVQTAKNFASSLFRSVMVYRDPQNNSLAARIQQQRKAQEETGSTTADRLAQAFARWW